MPFDPQASDLPVAVIGAGAMGRGIAQMLATCGCRVLLHDAAPDAAGKAIASIGDALGKLVDKGRLDAAKRDATIARLAVAPSLDALADRALVVEAIVEKLDVKRELFRQLEAVVAPDAVLASNTSSLSITAIAATCRRPARVVGWHFFNPVPLMKVAEVIDGLADRARGRRRVDDADAALRPHRGPREGHAGLHRQPCRPRLRHRGAADRRRRHLRLRRRRSRDARCRRLPARSVRAAGPDRARRVASGDGVDLPAVLRRAALPTVGDHRAAPGRRPPRAARRRAASTTTATMPRRSPSRRRRSRCPRRCGSAARASRRRAS